MGKLIETVGAVILTALLMLFVLPIVNTLVGAFIGLVVGLFFENAIFSFLSALGVSTMSLSMWQVGAALGFIGSFFRAIVSTKKID